MIAVHLYFVNKGRGEGKSFFVVKCIPNNMKKFQLSTKKIFNSSNFLRRFFFKLLFFIFLLTTSCDVYYSRSENNCEIFVDTHGWRGCHMLKKIQIYFIKFFYFFQKKILHRQWRALRLQLVYTIPEVRIFVLGFTFYLWINSIPLQYPVQHTPIKQYTFWYYRFVFADSFILLCTWIKHGCF